MANQFSDFSKDKDTQNVLEGLNNDRKQYSDGQTGAGGTGSLQSFAAASDVHVTAQLQQETGTYDQMQQNQLPGVSSSDQGHHGSSQDKTSFQNQLQSNGNERPGVHHKRHDGKEVNASFGILDAQPEEHKPDNASGKESNDQEGDKYEGSFTYSLLGSTPKTILAAPDTMSTGLPETNIPSGSQSMLSRSAKDETRQCLASDLAWQHFSVLICSSSGQKVAEPFKITNTDPTCFQYALSENYNKIVSIIKLENKYSFQIEKECLKLLIHSEDQDEILEDGMALKKQLIKFVINMYQCVQVKIPQRYQEYVFPHLQEVRPLLAREIVLLHCEEDVFKVAGGINCVKSAAESVLSIVKDAERVMVQNVQKDDKADVVSTDTGIVVMNISTCQIEIVQNLMQFQDVQLKYLADGIEISGVKAEIVKVQKEIKLKLAQVQPVYNTIPSNIGQFIWNHKNYVQSCLKSKNIKCVWSLPKSNTITVEALTKEEADSGLSEILACIKIDNITKNTKEMKQFLEKYNKKLAFQPREGLYEILMTDDIHDEFCRVKMMDEKPQEDSRMELQQNNDMETEERIPLYGQYGQFFSRFVKEKMIKFAKKHDVNFFMNDQNEICIQGKSSSVDVVKQKVSETVNELESNEDTCESSFNHTYFESKRKSTEDKNRCLITIKSSEKPEIMHARLTEHLVNVTTVHVGPIEQANADIIICPVRNDLLPIGVGGDIFCAGDCKKVQALTIEYLDHQKSGKMKDGHVAAVVATGRLHCQHNALAVWPLCSEIQFLDVNCIQVMAENVISLIMDTGSRTVAFPLFVSNAEIDIKVACLFLDRFRKSISGVGLFHYVQLLFYADRKSTGKIFVEQSTTIFPRRSVFEVDFHLAVEKKTWKKEMTLKPIDVEILKGSIADVDDQVNAIVNSTTYTLELNKGFVSSLLLKKAGNAIQQECDNAHSKGINFGGLAATGSGKLKCRAIFHIALYKWITDGEVSSEILKLVVRRCLHEAESREYKSIAFPALGAGNLQYPTYLVARTMQETIREFSLEYQPVYLKKVVIVLYQGDTEVIEAFEKIQSSIVSATKGNGSIADRKYLYEFPPKFMMQVHKTFGIKIMLADKQFYEKLKIKEARMILGLTMSKENATSPRWEERDNCFSFNINTDGSTSSIKDVLKKTVDVVLNMKHQVFDVFLLSNESGIQKQIECVIKVVTEKAEQILSTKNANMSASSQPVCYVKMIRMFMSSSEYRDIESKKKDKYPKDYSPWQVYEMDTKDARNQIKLEVFGHKTTVKDTLQSLKAHIEKSNVDDQPSTGQWYYCQLDGKREFPIPPELNVSLNNAADRKEQYTTGNMNDEKFKFDFDNMECRNSKEKLVHKLKYKEKQQSGATSTHTRSDQNARSLPEKPASPGKVLRTVSKEGKAMQEKIDAENDEDMDIITSTTGEIKQEYMEKAKQVLSKLNLGVQEVNGKLVIIGSFDIVKEANILLTSANLIESFKDRTDNDDKYSVEYYSMTADEYAGLVHFSYEETWFTTLKMHEWINENMKYSVRKKHIEEIRQCVKAKVDSMRLMGEAEIILTKSVSASDLNSIQLDLSQTDSGGCFFSYDKKRIKIKAENYERAQQIRYKVEVKLGITKQTGGIRKGRRFASNDPDYSTQSTDNKKGGEDFSRTVVPGNKPFNAGRSSTPSDHAEFHTKEGLKVLVYRGDILNLPVDCIVNAANADLQHGGGVAFFIAQAAGYSLLDESNDYIQINGPLPIGTSCSTTAGKMTQYHCVIHTVGPRWFDYNQNEKYDCLKLLKQSILSAIEEAEGHQHSSIAIPSISSGIFAVPKDLCAQEYFRAVEEFSKQSFRSSSLKEIHFVDKDAGMCRLVETAFKQYFNQSGKTTERPFNRSHSETGPSNDDKWLPTENNSDPLPPKKKVSRQNRILSNQFIFNFEGKISVKLMKGDITNSKTNVIVCPQDEKLQGTGKIAQAIHNKAYEVYKDSNAHNLKRMNLKTGDVYPLKAAESVDWKYVFHVVPPRWGLNSSRNPALFERNLEKVVLNLLLRIEEYYQIESVAIPLLGVSMDEKSYPTPLPTCVRGMANGIMKYAKNGNNKIDVEIWGFNDGVVSMMREIFSDKTNTGQSTGPDNETNFNSSRHQTGRSAENLNTTQSGNAERNFGHSGSAYTGDNNDKNEDLGKTLKVDTIKGESCCICMDNLTKPKRLSCGHIFCKECIDLAFKHKKACPSCGRVYGKLTGNQPKGGTMSRYDDKYKDLAGYKGCGHIKIFYSIPGGIQTDEHPNPGKFFEGITRPAYLPNNEKGKLVAALLKMAFNQRLIFTVGQSRTSGNEGVVTWNDIHHKTRMEGGTDRFGYPDPTYLDRVLDELAAKGITKDSLQDK